MLALWGPLLVALTIAQAPPPLATGEVVDEQGKPVVNARVVLYAPPLLSGEEISAEVEAETDASGQFRMRWPVLRRPLANGVNYLAHQPGLAIAARAFYRKPYRLVLHKARLRAIHVEGPDGRPVAGARIVPLGLVVSDGTFAQVPESLAETLAVTTGADGQATIGYLAPSDQLAAVRVTADPIGTQDFVLIDRPGRDSAPPIVTIKLNKTARLSGRVVDEDGKPLAGQTVEIWSRHEAYWAPATPVTPRGGPFRSANDGRFETPANLMVGSTYRAAVRAPDREPVFSNWVTIQPGMDLKALLPLRSRPLRSVRGRVVDRKGEPIANIEVFQSGDGPRRTSAHTDADGRFMLGGFRQGPVVVFAHGGEFRFHGQLIQQERGDVSVDIILTRYSEQPERAMRMLPDPIPLEESRALARRLIEPVWPVVLEHGEEYARVQALSAMVPSNPGGALEKLEEARIGATWASIIRNEAAVTLADDDPEEAAAVAESIADPARRIGALLNVARALPDDRRERRLALLDQAAPARKAVLGASEQLRAVGELAETANRLGETGKARELVNEGLLIASEMSAKTDRGRGRFLAQAALVDAPAAWTMLKDFHGDRQEGFYLRLMAINLAEKDPAGAERAVKQAESLPSVGLSYPLCWKLAEADPERARRLVLGAKMIDQMPEHLVFLAYGLRKRDPEGARQVLDEASRRIDALVRERPARFEVHANLLLPFVEAVDPKHVPEFFWRIAATRWPAGNPRSSYDQGTTSYRLLALAWYDRDVAAALFEPVRAQMERIENAELAARKDDFLAWALFDPRAAAARLERVPVSTDRGYSANDARAGVAGYLGLPHDQRWKTMPSGLDLFDVIARRF